MGLKKNAEASKHKVYGKVCKVERPQGRAVETKVRAKASKIEKNVECPQGPDASEVDPKEPKVEEPHGPEKVEAKVEVAGPREGTREGREVEDEVVRAADDGEVRDAEQPAVPCEPVPREEDARKRRELVPQHAEQERRVRVAQSESLRALKLH